MYKSNPEKPSLQIVHAKLRADGLRIRVGELPPAGATLGLGLDVVAVLPGGGPGLLLAAPHGSR